MTSPHERTTAEQIEIKVSPWMVSEGESAFSAYLAGAVSLAFALEQAYIAMARASIFECEAD